MAIMGGAYPGGQEFNFDCGEVRLFFRLPSRPNFERFKFFLFQSLPYKGLRTQIKLVDHLFNISPPKPMNVFFVED